MKVRDSAGVLRTVAAIHVRDATGLRTVAQGRIRNSVGSLKSFFTAGGAAPGVVVSIGPDFYATDGAAHSDTSNFTASAVGGVPTAYNWTVNGGTIMGGQGTATVSVKVTALTANEPYQADISCDITIGGAHYVATATKTYTWTL